MDMMDVVKGLGGLAGSGGGQANAAGALLALVNGSGGGLGGLVQAFQKHGLGDLVASWIGTGQNLPISPEQIGKVLGSQQLSQFASQAGVPPEAAGATLASMLPALIDKLTPDGQLPARNELPGLDVLAKLLS
ncbi:MAG: YidB family protein [Vicinamibacterales bacterium]